MESFRQRVYRIARQIPRGQVATYGDIARMAGAPQAAREVGWALRALPEGTDVPWWRIVNRFGAVSCRTHGTALQMELLREEGIVVDAEGNLDLAAYRWDH